MGIRTRIEAGATVQDSLILGADYYQAVADQQARLTGQPTDIPMGIGPNSTIRRAIVDKNARIGRDVQIINKDQVEEAEKEELGFYIRNGIVVILKGATIADGTII